MRHKRTYNPPAPAAVEKLPPCLKCGSENIKTLDNWLTNPCVRVIQCRICGRMADGTGETIETCKENALENWQDPACDLPPWWDDEDSLAAGITEGEA